MIPSIADTAVETAVVFPQTTDDIITWEYFDRKSEYVQSTFSLKRNNEEHWKILLKRVTNSIIYDMNRQANDKGRVLEYREILFGHRRITPNGGLELSLHLRLEYKKIRGTQIKMDVKKHLVLRIPFLSPQYRELTHTEARSTLHLILPLSGKFEAFRSFLAQFENVCSDLSCNLVIILYDSPSYAATRQAIYDSPLAKSITVHQGKGEFSRALALHQGITSLSSGSLVLFIDVDIHFTREALDRVRLHTIQGEQMYFPIVFSQYDSRMVCGADHCSVSQQTSDSGYFRFFGFGIASMYKEDYLACGGFDLSIHGWGKEDVDLYSKVLKTNLTVIRSGDPDLTHIYHPVICDPNLNQDQAVMCLNSKAASFASKSSLAEIYFLHYRDKNLQNMLNGKLQVTTKSQTTRKTHQDSAPPR